MKLDCVLLVILIICICAWCEDRLELPAFEFRRHFNKTLTPGQCPDRIIQYPIDPPTQERCTFPSRTGTNEVRTKPLSNPHRSSLTSLVDLFKVMPLCNQAAANYFGFLAKGDCITTEIAQKLTFDEKTVILVEMEHERLKINQLLPSNNLGNIPDEFTLYLNNSYYTQKIDIGTDELIILEMRFKKSGDASFVKSNYKHQKLSDYLKMIVTNASLNQPRKIKVIRLSTAENVFETKVFKGSDGGLQAMHYVRRCERHIMGIKHSLKYGNREAHLRYTFKAYEIGPIAFALQTISEDDKRRLWEEIAILQVEIKRAYTSNKKYRKICRSTTDYRKYCLLAKQTLRELKKTVTEVHTLRRDWSKVPYETQALEIKTLNKKLNILERRMQMVAKGLRKLTKKKP